MEPFSLEWATKAIGKVVTVIGKAPSGLMVERVVTDTRQDVRGGLFFALSGETFDGHAYIAEAFAKGAVGVVVSRERESAARDALQGTKHAGKPLLVAPHLKPLQILGILAAEYREKFDIPVVAVTGSVGKTSTKEMIATILRTRYNVLASEKNYNNEIGVPLTLFNLSHEHTAMVVEMGMRGKGQIEELTRIAAPTIGLVTNIGYAHMELLGSREAIADAKGELYENMTHADAIALLPYRDPFYERLKEKAGKVPTQFTFGIGDEKTWPPDVRVYPLPNRPDGGAEAIAMFHRKEAFFSMKAVGAHVLQNAAAALSVAFALDIPVAEAVKALESWEGVAGRMVVRQGRNGVTVLDDCYNAGPESMASALDTLRLTTVLPGVAVLGDMKELGDFALEAHRTVGRKVVDIRVRLLVTVGELAQEIGDEAKRYASASGKSAPQILACADSAEAAAKVPELVLPKETVLVKGSRAMEMETIVAALVGDTEQKADAHG